MPDAVRFQKENQLDCDSLFLAALLRYAAPGRSISNSLIQSIAPGHVCELEGEIIT